MADSTSARLPKRDVLPEIHVPIVDVTLPPLTLPEFPPKMPELDDRRREIVRYAVMQDVAELLEPFDEILYNLAHAELKKRMTREEYDRFLENDKNLPSFLAALKTFKDLEEKL